RPPAASLPLYTAPSFVTVHSQRTFPRSTFLITVPRWRQVAGAARTDPRAHYSDRSVPAAASAAPASAALRSAVERPSSARSRAPPLSANRTRRSGHPLTWMLTIL